MRPPSSRVLNTLSFVTTLLILSTVFYVEYRHNILPCTLCMLQRAALIAVGAIALIAALHNPRRWGIKVYGVFLFFFSSIGLLTAGRQLWLQSLPASEAPTSCGVDIFYLLQMLPFDKALTQILSGSAECAKVDWSFLGLSMAAWSFICFAAFLLIALRHFIKR